ncbi:hypothetical protein ABBQ38_006741 [Trebouxia sp. C0009 RCD-2024]
MSFVFSPDMAALPARHLSNDRFVLCPEHTLPLYVWFTAFWLYRRRQTSPHTQRKATNAFLLGTHAVKGEARCLCLTTDCCSNQSKYLQQGGPDISHLDPALQQQWDHAANAHLGNMIIKPYSAKKVWWTCDQCPDGHLHRWLALVHNRTSGRGCPQCSSRAVCKHNCLATKAPKVAAQWDYDANTGTPDSVVAQSGTKVGWRCGACGHKWRASPHARVSKLRSGCPQCKENAKTKKRFQHPTFAECQHPLLAEWDHKRNAAQGHFPENTKLRSKKKIFWLCTKCPAGQEHSWRAQPCVRTTRNQTGCPFCAGQTACRCNSLQALYPGIAAEWDHSKNEGQPSDFTGSSTHLAWWFSPQRASWQQRIYRRTSPVQQETARLRRLQQRRTASRAGCLHRATHCQSNQREHVQQGGPSISRLDASLQQQWDHAANAHLGNIEIKPQSGRRVWWRCDQCPDGHLHRWFTKVEKRTNGTGCPQCSGREVCKHNSLATKAPKVAAQWDHSVNVGSPDSVLAQSNHKVGWQCDKCGCKWTASPNARVSKMQSGCPRCHEKAKTKKRFQHPTFAECQHPLLAEWDHKRNAAQGHFPKNTKLRSNKKIFWLCTKCPAGQEHSWPAPPCNRTTRNLAGCPFCAGHAACRCNSLQAMYPDIAAEWDRSRNAGQPSDFTGSSTHLAWWSSPQRASWRQSITARTQLVQQRITRLERMQQSQESASLKPGVNGR